MNPAPEGDPPGREPQQQPPGDTGAQPPPPAQGPPPPGQPAQQYGQPYGAQPQYSLPNAPGAAPALVLGVIGIVLCPVCAPFAWAQGQKGERAFDAAPGTYGGRGMATAGRILGIIGTVLLAIYVLIFVGAIIAAIVAESSS